jgi:hypothetical protein
VPELSTFPVDLSTYPIKRIVVAFIDQAEQRYDTVGDYWLEEDGTLQFRSTAFKDWRMAYACIMHELAEAALCLHVGVTFADIDDFDKRWEAARQAAGLEAITLADGTEIDEPGDDPSAPYYEQHKTGDIIERIFANACGLNWQAYEKAVGEAYD